MLEPAIKYKDQLEKLWYNIWFDDKYKYWNSSVYYDELQLETITWDKHQFVSVLNGKVIGYIAYAISRETHSVHGLNIVNFSDNKIAFGKDLGRALKDIFEKFGFRKLNFFVIIGNPVEKSYDKMIERYGGRIVGVYEKEIRLIDGQYYDKKTYEILADNYFKTIKRHIKNES